MEIGFNLAAFVMGFRVKGVLQTAAMAVGLEIILKNLIKVWSSSLSSTVVSDPDSPSIQNPSTIFDDSGDDPKMVKTRLRQWAQVVACAVRQSASPKS
ncbi:hypothetical protein LOK49_LG02G03482 [Camellia lanceoleosa]|uniref:Uncharacterized protein n=1 Tax=Camellia lanceoleosa TaxID=1840588 RepID=A0ACC0INU8_9ERIC|nr:hypothetical protein LOK49_LG02G03482 [Camellia lanceoleosa]